MTNDPENNFTLKNGSDHMDILKQIFDLWDQFHETGSNSTSHLHELFDGITVPESEYYDENIPRNNDVIPQNPSVDSCMFDSPWEYRDLTQIQILHFIFILVYMIVIIVSMVGNFMVIWTVYRNKHMRTVTNYYIMNLAICDFIVSLFVMPLKLLEYTAPCSWNLFKNDALCSICGFFLPVFVFASVLTLVAISIERCYAIVHPISAMTGHSKSKTLKILLATWLLPIVLCLPYLFYKSYAFNITSDLGTIDRQICQDRFDEIDFKMGRKPGTFRKVYFFVIFLIMYLIPMLTILITCVRIAMCLLKPLKRQRDDSNYSMEMTKRRDVSKRRVARMIIMVALSFIICWTPFYVINVVSQLQTISFLHKSNFIFTMLTAHFIGFLNSAINPFIYHFMSERFRKSFRTIMYSVICCCWPWWRNSNSRKYSWADECDHYCKGPHCQSHNLPGRHCQGSHNPRQRYLKRRAYQQCHLNQQSSNTRHKTKQAKKLNLSKNRLKESNRTEKRLSSENTSTKWCASEELERLNQRPQKFSSESDNKDYMKTQRPKTDKAILVCGPFCVCGCQSCSFYSSDEASNSYPSDPNSMLPNVGTAEASHDLHTEEIATPTKKHSKGCDNSEIKESIEMRQLFKGTIINHNVIIETSISDNQDRMEVVKENVKKSAEAENESVALPRAHSSVSSACLLQRDSFNTNVRPHFSASDSNLTVNQLK